MKTSSKTMLLAVMLTISFVIGSCSKGVTPGLAQNDDGKVEELETKMRLLKEQEELDMKLGQYAINMMAKTSGRSISDSLKLSLARSIVRVSNDIFTTVDARKGWIVVLSIESGFNRLAQSPTGPKGYGQLARASFFEALKACGFGDVRETDVWDTELNLYASACYFHQMLEQSDHDPYAAIVFYNQGPNSEAAKQYAKHGTMDNVEALKYVARFSFLKRKVDDKPIAGAPSIKEIPAPSAPKPKQAKPVKQEKIQPVEPIPDAQ